MLHFSDFKKSYDNHTVIAIADLQLKEDIYWLQGQNGSGKTSLIKSIAGLIPFSGRIAINDIDIRKQRKLYRLSVNWADAEPIYPAFLTGTDLIHFYEQTLKGNPKKTKKIVEAFEADRFIHQKLSTYSSGMTKKLSLIVAFIGQPKWILLDEPLITLDVSAAETCLTLINAYSKKGVSFLISSHQSLNETALFTSTQLIIQNQNLLVA